MRKSYIILLTLTVLFLMGIGAQAMEYKTIERHNGASTFASWTKTNGDIITDTALSLTETNDGTDIYLDIYTYDSNWNYLSEKSGHMFTKDDVLNIDKRFNSASLSEVKIDLYDWNTGEKETATVKSYWTYKGDITKSSSTYTSKSGNFIWKSNSVYKSKEASATGSINGMDLGESYSAGLNLFKEAYMSMEK